MKKKVLKFINFSTADPSIVSSHWLQPDLDTPGCCLFSDNLILIVLISCLSHIRNMLILHLTLKITRKCSKIFCSEIPGFQTKSMSVTRSQTTLMMCVNLQLTGMWMKMLLTWSVVTSLTGPHAMKIHTNSWMPFQSSYRVAR